MTTTPKTLFSFMLLWLPLLSFAAPWAGNTTLRFENFDIDDGLSQNSISSIVQDKYGFMWFSTQGGINRYDGKQFEVFKHIPDDSRSLSDSYVETLFVDKKGDLWIGTYNGGLNRFDYQTETFVNFLNNPTDPHQIRSNRVTAIAQVHSNELLIGTFGGGLSRFDIAQGRFQAVHAIKEESRFHQINSIAADTLGRAWLATHQDGLVRIGANERFFTSFVHKADDASSLSHNNVTALLFDRKGVLWVGSDNGLNRYDAKCECFSRMLFNPDPTKDAPGSIIKAIVEDHHGRLWLATHDGVRIVSSDRKSIKAFKHNPSDKHSISSNLVSNLFISRDDNMLWAANFTTGGDKLDLDALQFNHYKNDPDNKHSLSSNFIWDFYEADNGDIWIATDGGGINRFNRQTEVFEVFKSKPNDPNTIGSNSVWTIVEDEPGVFWLGTYDAGLDRFDSNTGEVSHFRHSDDPQSLPNNHVISLLIDSDNQLWVGTADGLSLFNRQTGKFRHFKNKPNDPNSISGNWIAAIYEDRQNRLWVNTAGGGVNRYDRKTGRFTRLGFDPEQPFSSAMNVTPMVMQDSQGDIWATTYGAGIARLNKDKGYFTRLTEADGLVHNSALGIVEGAPHDLWITTNNGLSRFDSHTGKFIDFGVDDGLQSNEFNSGAYLKTHDGEIFLGGVNGFNRFYPQKVRKIAFEPEIKLTQLRVFNRPVVVGDNDDSELMKLSKPLYLLDEIQLSHKQSLMAFEFSSLSYSHHQEIEYQYRLEGFDEQWITTDHQLRRATYTGVPSGHYQFKVRARMRHMAWSDKETVLAVEILPSPWRSAKAYTLYAMAIASLVGLIAWQRYRRFVAIKQGQERLTLALWGSHSELWDWDLEKNTVYRSNHFKQNSELEGVSQFNYDQLRDFIHEQEIDGVIDKLEQHIRNESDYFDATYRRRTIDDQWVWYRSRAQAVERDSNGKALRIVGTVSDVNELKETQTELKLINEDLESRVDERTRELTNAMEKLQNTQLQLVESEKMASLADLVVGMSHELNTPLGVALTSKTLIEDKLAELSVKKAQRQMRASDFEQFEVTAMGSLKLLGSNITRAIELVNSFKSLSPKADDDTLSEVNLAQHLQDITIINQGFSDDYTAKLNIDCPADLIVRTYAADLLEIFKELLKNSYTHGFTTSGFHQIDIHARKEGEAVVLIYRDNGLGVDKSQHKKIFEPFYTSQRGTACIGLGLTVIYNKIYYRMSGAITMLDDQPGFAIRFDLPIDLAQVPSSKAL